MPDRIHLSPRQKEKLAFKKSGLIQSGTALDWYLPWLALVVPSPFIIEILSIDGFIFFPNFPKAGSSNRLRREYAKAGRPITWNS